MTYYPFRTPLSSPQQILVDALKPRSTAAVAALRQHVPNQPFLRLPTAEADLPEIARWGDRIRNRAAHLVVMGTGGSSLGGLALTYLRRAQYLPSGMNVHFIENVDPHSLNQLFSELPLADCFFLAISKSGNTAETLASFLLVLKELTKNGLNPAEQCLAVTMPGDRPLRRLAQHFGFDVLDHDGDLGGRFSVLSVTGLLPAATAGLDIYALRKGAADTMAALWEQEADSAPAQGAALHYQMFKQGCTMSLLMPYCDRLEPVGRWYQQLWAESLGKNGGGSTPLRALGAVDQHSQLQLYLDGPRDKFITLIQVEAQEEIALIDKHLAATAGMEFIGGHLLGSLFTALYQGTAATFRNRDVPLRELVLPEVSEHAVGALLQHLMLETALMALLMGVNAYDQPAVEESKERARDWLASQARSGL